MVPIHFQEQVKIPEQGTQSPRLLPPACPASFVSHHLPQVHSALLLCPIPLSSLKSDVALLDPWAFAHSFHSIWDALHSPVWLVNCFIHFKSQLNLQLASATPVNPQLGGWALSSISTAPSLYTPLILQLAVVFSPLFNSLPSSLGFKSSQSNRRDRHDIGHKTIWQVPGTKEMPLNVYEQIREWAKMLYEELHILIIA